MRDVYERSERGARKLNREAKIGDVLYVIEDIDQKLAPYEDAHLYSRQVVTMRSPVTGNPMISGSLSVAALVLRFGPVYTKKPKGIRDIAKPGPQVAGPVPKGHEAELTEAEIRRLQKRVKNGSHPRTRRPLGTWRV